MDEALHRQAYYAVVPSEMSVEAAAQPTRVSREKGVLSERSERMAGRIGNGPK